MSVETYDHGMWWGEITAGYGPFADMLVLNPSTAEELEQDFGLKTPTTAVQKYLDSTVESSNNIRWSGPSLYYSTRLQGPLATWKTRLSTPILSRSRPSSG